MKRRSPVRLLIGGALLLWVVTPLLLGGLITSVVRASDGGGIGVGLGVLFVLWAVVALVVLAAGFAGIIAGVFLWWRARSAAQLVETEQDSAPPPSCA